MKQITKLTVATALPAVALSAQVAQAAPAEKLSKPNVIFFLIEDTSPQYVGLYNDGKGGKLPNLEALSKEMIIFDNAFSNAPVSSAARTTLVTGCYAPRFGGSLHRRLEELEMPEGLRMMPSYLRDLGYYTSNVIKTDYNVKLDPTAWDNMKGKMGDWRNRPDKSQPFFFMRSNTVTHESRLLFKEEVYKTKKTVTDPESVNIHPNLPQTDLMKYTYATFYDRMLDADKEFGQMLKMLKEDGLMDDTFIFFFGDNGGCVPESKGYTNDNGFRVPLLVYVPEKWREEIGIKVGEHHDGLVSFMDFGPTVIHLAGGKVPTQANGVPFLGKGTKPGQESVMCYGDRFDDLYAFNRALYRDNFRYARNYIPYHTRGMNAYYRYKSLAFQEARELYYAGKLNEHQARFFEPMGAEELYDLKADPNETRNLANDPKYASVLKKMRAELASKVDGFGDLGFLPETIINEEAMANPATYGVQHKKQLVTYRKIADLQMAGYSEKTQKALDAAVASSDKVEQWWGLTTASAYCGDIAKCDAFVAKAKALSKSGERSFLRARAYVTLAKFGKGKIGAAEVKDMLSNAKTLGETLLVLNDLTYMSEAGLLPKVILTEKDVKFSDHSVDERRAYLAR